MHPGLAEDLGRDQQVGLGLAEQTGGRQRVAGVDDGDRPVDRVGVAEDVDRLVEPREGQRQIPAQGGQLAEVADGLAGQHRLAGALGLVGRPQEGRFGGREVALVLLGHAEVEQHLRLVHRCGVEQPDGPAHLVAGLGRTAETQHQQAALAEGVARDRRVAPAACSASSSSARLRSTCDCSASTQDRVSSTRTRRAESGDDPAQRAPKQPAR